MSHNDEKELDPVAQVINEVVTQRTIDPQGTLVDDWPPAGLHALVTALCAQQLAKFSSSSLPT